MFHGGGGHGGHHGGGGHGGHFGNFRGGGYIYGGPWYEYDEEEEETTTTYDAKGNPVSVTTVTRGGASPFHLRG